MLTTARLLTKPNNKLSSGQKSISSSNTSVTRLLHCIYITDTYNLHHYASVLSSIRKYDLNGRRHT